MPRIRPVLLSGALLIAALAAAPAAVSLAQAAPPPERIDRVRVQRPIAEDPQIDQILVASLPAPSAPNSDENESYQQIAAIGPAMRPLVPAFNPAWPSDGEITTYFGEVGPYSPRGHSGLDVAAPQGTPILAADQGEVLKAYWNTDGYGGLVIIGHPSGYETWYGHLVRFMVEPGELVRRGETIGLMGSTGLSTGPHVHFEVRQDGQVCDPLKFLNEASLRPAD